MSIPELVFKRYQNSHEEASGLVELLIGRRCLLVFSTQQDLSSRLAFVEQRRSESVSHFGYLRGTTLGMLGGSVSVDASGLLSLLVEGELPLLFISSQHNQASELAGSYGMISSSHQDRSTVEI
jgi:hypothetical protein